MKVLPFKISKLETETLVIQKYSGKTFYEKLHQHEECQISLIVSGEGAYVVGDYVGRFSKGDIFVLGENLPHIFKSDDTEKDNVTMIAIFFTENAFGKDFFKLPEFTHLSELFKNISIGVKVKSNKEKLQKLIVRIFEETKFKRFLTFFELLHTISKSKTQTLSSIINLKKYDGNEGKRMRNIFQYTMNNFEKEISLTDVAYIANMTPNAFCRYFKQRTNKTFFNFLIDIRIGHACRLLSKNKDLNITEVCYQSGFHNLANFNRKFKAIKGITPSAYRKNR